jgi:hypothetical protein
LNRILHTCSIIQQPLKRWKSVSSYIILLSFSWNIGVIILYYTLKMAEHRRVC